MPTSRSEALTRGVRIQVECNFLPERSQPQNNLWLFGYQVVIANEGSDTVQLLRRHWVITNAMGQVEEVKGDGVVGHKPVLPPGKSFTYTSLCPLRTPFGIMHGTYEMLAETGEKFEAEIAPFQLGEPTVVH